MAPQQGSDGWGGPGTRHMPRKGHPLNCLGTKLGARGMSPGGMAGQRGWVTKLGYSDVTLHPAERSGCMPASVLLTDVPLKAGLILLHGLNLGLCSIS